MEVDLEYGATIVGEGDDGTVCGSVDVVEF